MTVPRETLDADKQPVWTEPHLRKRKAYHWNKPEDHKGRGPLAFIVMCFGALAALVGLSQK